MLDTKQIFSKMFMWLFLGLAITFGMGYAIQGNEPLLNTLFSNGSYFIIWIVQIVLAIVLSARIHKMSPVVASVLYILYTALTGLTFASIFILYDLTSIIYVFLATAGVLLIFGILGYKTKIDLTKISTYLMMGILGIIILSLISIFVKSLALNLGITILSLVIFMAYIAFDIQMIKRKFYMVSSDESLAILGAFQLYLDFINIFLDLLSLFGKNRD